MLLTGYRSNMDVAGNGNDSGTVLTPISVSTKVIERRDYMEFISNLMPWAMVIFVVIAVVIPIFLTIERYYHGVHGLRTAPNSEVFSD